MKNIHKLIILLITSSFAFACSSNNNVISSEEPDLSSSSIEISSTSSGSTSKPNDNKNKRVYNFDDDITLENDNKTCANHELSKETIIKKAYLVNRGVLRKSCPTCEGFKDSYYYYLDEFDYLDATYQYDGKARELLIDGLLPYGVTVKYENNKLTEIGSKEATALIYDPEGHLIDFRTATLSIVENTGLPNIKIITDYAKSNKPILFILQITGVGTHAVNRACFYFRFSGDSGVFHTG